VLGELQKKIMYEQAVQQLGRWHSQLSSRNESFAHRLCTKCERQNPRNIEHFWERGRAGLSGRLDSVFKEEKDSHH
jgi:hypothetical protein